MEGRLEGEEEVSNYAKSETLYNRDAFYDLPELLSGGDDKIKSRLYQLLDSMVFKSEMRLKFNQDFPNNYDGSDGYHVTVDEANNRVEFTPLAASGIYGMRYYDGSQTGISSSPFGASRNLTLIADKTLDYDSDNYHQSGKITIPTGRGGLYLINCHARIRPDDSPIINFDAELVYGESFLGPYKILDRQYIEMDNHSLSGCLYINLDDGDDVFFIINAYTLSGGTATTDIDKIYYSLIRIGDQIA